MFVLFKQIHESLHFETNEKKAKKKEDEEEEEEEEEEDGGGRKNRYSLILTNGRTHYEHMNDS